MNDTIKASDRLGLGLSRLLRYSFAGFLALLIWWSQFPASVDKLQEDLSAPLLATMVVVIGAGIYMAHRVTIIPLNHLVLQFCFWLFHDKRCCKDGSCSTNGCQCIDPVRYLKFAVLNATRFKVKELSTWCPIFQAMIAYSVVRKDDTIFPDRKDRDVAHAENGFIVMLAAAAFFMAAFEWGELALPWIAIGVVLFVISLVRGWALHAEECRVLHAAGVVKLKEALKPYGWRFDSSRQTDPNTGSE